MSLLHAIEQAFVTHLACAFPSDWTQSLSVAQPDGWHRCVVVLQVLPEAQSRSPAHAK